MWNAVCAYKKAQHHCSLNVLFSRVLVISRVGSVDRHRLGAGVRRGTEYKDAGIKFRIDLNLLKSDGRDSSQRASVGACDRRVDNIAQNQMAIRIDTKRPLPRSIGPFGRNEPRCFGIFRADQITLDGRALKFHILLSNDFRFDHILKGFLPSVYYRLTQG